MSDPNFNQQAGDFAMDAAIDTAADNLANEALNAVVSRVPGGQAIEQMLDTEVDQMLNNEIAAMATISPIICAPLTFSLRKSRAAITVTSGTRPVMGTITETLPFTSAA